LSLGAFERLFVVAGQYQPAERSIPGRTQFGAVMTSLAPAISRLFALT